jgi:hypothetical protein
MLMQDILSRSPRLVKYYFGACLISLFAPAAISCINLFFLRQYLVSTNQQVLAEKTLAQLNAVMHYSTRLSACCLSKIWKGQTQIRSSENFS